MYSLCKKAVQVMIYSIILLVLGIILLILAAFLNQTLMIIAAIFIVGGAVLLIDYLLVPKAPIKYDGANLIIKSVTIPLTKVVSVKADSQSIIGLRFNCGKVIIFTFSAAYSVKYISDYKECCKKISELKAE